MRPITQAEQRAAIDARQCYDFETLREEVEAAKFWSQMAVGLIVGGCAGAALATWAMRLVP